MGDEELYLEAKREVESEDKDTALWTKALTLADGNEERATFKYIKLRVEQLNNPASQRKSPEKTINTKTTPPSPIANTDNEFNRKYLPVTEFSSIKSMAEQRVIELIKEGFYVGQIKNNEWFISREELGEDIDSALQIPTTAQKEHMPIEEFAKYKNLSVEDTIEMIKNGDFEGQLIDGEWFVPYSQVNASQDTSAAEDELTGFTWWQIWGWMGLILGDLYLFSSIEIMPELTIILIILNTILMVMILKFNKYAFLIATLLSFNPLLWIINGIYLKNRWHHPKVNSQP